MGRRCWDRKGSREGLSVHASIASGVCRWELWMIPEGYDVEKSHFLDGEKYKTVDQ